MASDIGGILLVIRDISFHSLTLYDNELHWVDYTHSIFTHWLICKMKVLQKYAPLWTIHKINAYIYDICIKNTGHAQRKHAFSVSKARERYCNIASLFREIVNTSRNCPCPPLFHRRGRKSFWLHDAIELIADYVLIHTAHFCFGSLNYPHYVLSTKFSTSANVFDTHFNQLCLCMSCFIYIYIFKPWFMDVEVILQIEG